MQAPSSFEARVAQLSPAKRKLLEERIKSRGDSNSGRARSLIAVVTAAEGAQAQGIREHMGQHLPQYMVPSQIVVVDDLPRTPNGKVDRAALEQTASTLIEPSDTNKRARYESITERQLAGIWKDVLELDTVYRDDNYFDIGGTSLMAIRINAIIQDKMLVNLPIGSLLAAPSVAEQARLIEDRYSVKGNVIVKLKDGKPGSMPIFLIHGQGGTLLGYRHFVKELPDDFTVYGVQAPALSGTEAPFTDVHTMAYRYVDELKSIQPEGPYRLIGFSGGGKTVFEMGIRFRELGDSVADLILIDPVLTGAKIANPPPPRLVAALQAFKRMLLMPWSEKVSFVKEKWDIHVMHRFVPPPEPVGEDSPEWEQNMWASRKALTIAYTDYELTTPFDGDAVFIWPEDNGLLDPYLPWQEKVIGNFRVVTMPGDHYAPTDIANADFIADTISKTFMRSEPVLEHHGE